MERLNSEKILAEEVGILDNNSEWLGIPKSHLMECAGYSFTIEIVKRYKLDQNNKVAIFCGTGNNGGDGFVIARHLSSFDIKSLVILVGPPEKIRTKEARLNWKIISENLTNSIKIDIVRDAKDLEEISKNIKNDKNIKLVIDGLLGTGIKGKLRQPISFGIDVINTLKDVEVDRLPVISIDVPSGLDPNTGKVFDKAVRADLVITFHRNKKGMNINSEYIKDLIVKSIGIPQEASLFVGKGDFQPTMKVRKPDAHKGQHGKVLIIGGSKNYSGAPAFSSLAGINFGIDLVTTFVPETIGEVLRKYSPNMIVRTNPGDWLNMGAYDEIVELIEWADSIVIGPGLGQQKETEELLIKIIGKINQVEKPYVLDADALKLIKEHIDLIKGRKVILTPHEGELKILTGVELQPYNDIEQRGTVIHKIAKELGVTLLVKGQYDYVSNGIKCKINRTGCPEMSVGGTGDVLAGFCASFLAIDNEPFESACSAAFLNGYIGEFCKETIGSRFTAMDMINNMNKAILKLEKFQNSSSTTELEC